VRWMPRRLLHWAACSGVRRRLGPHCQTQSLGSDWGVGPCQLISADSIYDDFLNPAALMTCTALAHAARACSCMVCFSAGYILPDLRKLTLYALNEALIRGRSAEKTADPWSTATAVRTTLAVCRCCFIVADAARSGSENRTKTEIAAFSSKPNRNRPTLASMKP